jgi:phospholipid/cholesterol/gamma-HCH transport system permease protein
MQQKKSQQADPPPQTLSVEVRREGEGRATILLVGRLDDRTLPEAWAAVEPIRSAPPKRLAVDGRGLGFCDGAGLGLFVELRRIAATAGGEIVFEGLTPDLERLVVISSLQDPLASQLRPAPPPGFVSRLGRSAAATWEDIRDIIAFVGEAVAALAWAAVHPTRVRYRDVWMIAEKAGADALPVVALLGGLMGLILAYQSATPLGRFGAQSMIPMMVAFAVIRELGPLITAILLAGRSGAAFAAEIGTMKVTEELDALSTFGLEPMRFLVVPRVLAALLVTPLLSVFNILMGLVGGYVIMWSLGYSATYYVNSIVQSVTYVDLAGGVAKTFVFALLVAAIGCQRGLKTGKGPGAVGDSTTRAVVAGIVLTIVADGVLGAIYYQLDI